MHALTAFAWQGPGLDWAATRAGRNLDDALCAGSVDHSHIAQRGSCCGSGKTVAAGQHEHQLLQHSVLLPGATAEQMQRDHADVCGSSYTFLARVLEQGLDSPSFTAGASLLQCMMQHCIQQVSSLCSRSTNAYIACCPRKGLGLQLIGPGSDCHSHCPSGHRGVTGDSSA